MSKHTRLVTEENQNAQKWIAILMNGIGETMSLAEFADALSADGATEETIGAVRDAWLEIL